MIQAVVEERGDVRVQTGDINAEGPRPLYVGAPGQAAESPARRIKPLLRAFRRRYHRLQDRSGYVHQEHLHRGLHMVSTNGNAGPARIVPRPPQGGGYPRLAITRTASSRGISGLDFVKDFPARQASTPAALCDFGWLNVSISLEDATSEAVRGSRTPTSHYSFLSRPVIPTAVTGYRTQSCSRISTRQSRIC